MAGAADALAGDAPQGRLIRIKAASAKAALHVAMRDPLLLLFAVVVMATPAVAQERAQRERGAVLVQRYCASCHAVGPGGASPNSAAPAFRELHRRYSINSLSEALAEGMLVGHPAMPEFEFQPNDIKAIVGYLKSIQTHQDAGGPRLAGR